jgi:putative hydrolase of the HAD superfamily
MLKNAFETGRIDIDEYLRKTVFYRERQFSKQEFQQFMFKQSHLLGGTLEWLRGLSATGKHLIFALNNESRALHEYRVREFSLNSIFRAFFTSCYLGQVKPDEDIYLNAMGMAGCVREQAVFVDDRAVNVESAQVLGLRTILFQGLDALRQSLAEEGVEF